MVLCGASSPVLGQETLAGKFKLAENTRFANKLFPAGTYTFSVEPAGMLQSVSAIQGAWQPVVMVVRPESKPGRIVIIVALASRRSHSIDANKIILGTERDGTAMRAMYLDQEGLVLDLDWASPKNKTQMLAQAARPQYRRPSQPIDERFATGAEGRSSGLPAPAVFLLIHRLRNFNWTPRFGAGKLRAMNYDRGSLSVKNVELDMLREIGNRIAAADPLPEVLGAAKLKWRGSRERIRSFPNN